MIKAILLLSGGLDSTLAGKLMMELGVAVEAFNVVSPFCRCTPRSMGCSAAQHAAAQLGIPVHSQAAGQEYLDIVKHPRFGRGKRMNPCLDCRVHLFSLAKRHMADVNADFIATGDVLGERPMSQNRRAMDLIERMSGLAGLVLRPLSARLLPPTRPEMDGKVDRSRLLALSGRRRTPQFELAGTLGITDYLCPAGGCLLTDPGFARRLNELFTTEPDCSLHEVNMLKYGRHFRLGDGTKVIVGRNERENACLVSASRPGDVLVAPESVNGPTALCLGHAGEEDTIFAARAIASFTKGGSRIDRMNVTIFGGRDCRPLNDICPLSREELASFRIW